MTRESPESRFTRAEILPSVALNHRHIAATHAFLNLMRARTVRKPFAVFARNRPSSRIHQRPGSVATPPQDVSQPSLGDREDRAKLDARRDSFTFRV